MAEQHAGPCACPGCYVHGCAHCASIGCTRHIHGQPPTQHATGWIDRDGDVWHLGADGLMHTPETAPFPREHVERKWGPLRPARVL